MIDRKRTEPAHTLGYKILGTAGDWVVCWPCLFNDHREFKIFAQALSYDHRILLIDPPGLGLSFKVPSPMTESLGYLALASDVIDRVIRNDPFHFIGHGNGGHLGIILAGKYQTCKSLTLSGTPILEPIYVNPLKYKLNLFLLRFRLTEWIPKTLLVNQYKTKDKLDALLIRALLNHSIDNSNRKTLIKTKRLPAHTIEHYRALLSLINQPVLVIAGVYDTMIPNQALIADIAKRGYYCEVTSGYMTFLTSAAECARYWIRFVREIQDRRKTDESDWVGLENRSIMRREPNPNLNLVN